MVAFLAPRCLREGEIDTVKLAHLRAMPAEDALYLLTFEQAAQVRRAAALEFMRPKPEG